MTALQRRLAQRLAQRRASDLWRQRLTLDGAQGPEVTVAGQQLLNFSSNDYLGLAAHPRLRDALVEGAQRYGVGSGASHLVCGHMQAHETLEQALAEFCGRPRALLFGSGYQANLGVLGSVLGRGDAVFEDRLNHASLLDGGLASGARFQRFAHNDSADLARRLVKCPEADLRLVAVDGVFSMDGDTAPLPALASVCEQHDAQLMVDDAHGFGVLGPGGRGSVAAAGLDEQAVPIYMATLGKALGTAGAFIAGSDDLIDALLQTARTYIYTTAPPPALAHASLCALQLLREEDWRAQHVQALVQRFRRAARQLGLPLSASETPIQPLLLGDAHAAVAMAQRLRHAGILAVAIRPPTVPEGSSRLRLTLTAGHTEQHIDRLLEQLDACYERR